MSIGFPVHHVNNASTFIWQYVFMVGRVPQSGIESRWGRDFPLLSRPAQGSSQPPVPGHRVFPGGKERPGRDADPSSPSSAIVKKE